MSVFHVLNCTNANKSRKASHIMREMRYFLFPTMTPNRNAFRINLSGVMYTKEFDGSCISIIAMFVLKTDNVPVSEQK